MRVRTFLSNAAGCLAVLYGAASCATDAGDANPEPNGTGATTSGSGGSGTGATGGTQSGDGGNASDPGGSVGGASGRAGSSGSAGGQGSAGTGATGGSESNAGASDSGTSGSAGIPNPLNNPASGPPAGNPDGACPIPSDAGLADVSNPTTVVGSGTKESCTGADVIAAVARGGVITFDCGPDPVTITLDAPAKVFNDASDDVVIDGGGRVTLSGGGTSRILYMNTCDQNQVWTSDHCDNQETPRLTVQNLTFVEGNSKAETEFDGGGAIWVRGGRFRVVNSRFFNNVCADEGPDVGGAAIRVLSQFDGRPVYVVNSTFGGAEGLGNTCSNGGGISSIGVSWTVINSLFTHNRAVGDGGNPAEAGTPGGGSGGAIYNDGNTIHLNLCGTRIESNQVNAYGSAIFFVSNDHSGTLTVRDSVIRKNSGGGWNVLPGISMHDDTMRVIENSVIE